MKSYKKILLAALCLYFVSGPSVLHAQSVTSLGRISQDSTGIGGNASSNHTAIGANGRYVVFDSSANNLVTNDGNSSSDIFLKSLTSGITQRINLTSDSREADDNSSNPSVTGTAMSGFFAVAYESDATNLTRVAGFHDTNQFTDIYFTLPNSNATERISVAPGKTEADGPSSDPSIAMIPEPNKLIVAYSSQATNLVSGDTNHKQDIFLATLTVPSDITQLDYANDLVTICITCQVGGVVSNGDSGKAKISGTGRYVTFESEATNLISGISPTKKQIYVYDSSTGLISLVSKSSSNVPGDDDSFSPSISYAGTFIAYQTTASNILPAGSLPSPTPVQVLRLNQLSGSVTRVNVTSSGVGGDGTSTSSLTTSISPNGRMVGFSDSADNLASGDSNSSNDIFVKDVETGGLIRISSTSSGSSGDSASTFPAFAGASYNSTNGLMAFDSLSTNLISGDTENRPDTFLATLTTSAPLLNKSSIIEVPPDATLTNRKASISALKFSGASLTSSSKLRRAALAATSRASKKPKVQYRYQIFKIRDNQTKKNFRKVVSKRNSFAFKNLPNGTYESTYRAEIVVKGKVKSKTKFSPPQRFKVG